MAARAQAGYLSLGFKTGQTALFMHPLSLDLYAHILAVLGLGGTVMLVEPWMHPTKIQSLVEKMKPEFFFSNWMGKLWGLRLPAVRKIKHWRIPYLPSEGLQTLLVPPEQPGILTFTSGSTGIPKGVVRNHGYLSEQVRVLSKACHLDQLRGNDLCIFANFVLLNLATNRGSIVISPKWKPSELEWVARLPESERPISLTCGPGFLERFLAGPKHTRLQSLHLGGALTDIALAERALALYPEAQCHQLYGSTEVEPVAVIDLKESCEKSRKLGYFHTLVLGQAIDEIQAQERGGSLWVHGPHVCPEYLENADENRLNKWRDNEGRIWHNMGDRITHQNGDWVYSGRAGGNSDDFWLEQKVYHLIGHSRAFLDRRDGRLRLVGEVAQDLFKTQITPIYPEITELIPAIIQRDARHRARIDRQKTLEKA